MRALRFSIRVLLLLPPAVLFVAGILEASTSPFKWSTDRSYSVGTVQDWVASLSPFIVAAPAVLSSIWALVDLSRRTRQRFKVSPLLLCFGLFAIASLTLLE